MDAKEIRDKFLQFFKNKGHEIVRSAPLVNKNDPTLLFTNAGMNQFKDYFLGDKTAPYLRAVDTQKCLRVSGKHNDLEEVGMDTYHHTFFEMLGNWSFGDYFKKEAIFWAWELLTEVYKLPADRLYVSVFGGDESDNLEIDEESKKYWSDIIGPDRILHGSKKDNFWEMGDTGPCGPCSEIHIDLRKNEEREKIPGKQLVNNDHPLVVEIWNLVFMEFNRQSSGQLIPLPSKHVDTGMGFERLCMAIQGKTSNYDTDIFTPLISRISSLANISYGEDPNKNIAIRVIADHVRAIAFAVADGQLPSNNGAGYVIRRILRRAIRYGYTFLGFNQPVIYKLVPILSDQFKNVFPSLAEQQDFVANVIEQEENSFLNTLENGLKRLDSMSARLRKEKSKMIPGALAFELYDTFGFPLDLTSLIARERGLEVDIKGFDNAMKDQKTRSKADAEKETGDWTIVSQGDDSVFVGYDSMEQEVKILKYRILKQKGRELYQIILDRTPFYAESGGQVGDTGELSNDNEKIRILDTKKENDLIVHFVDHLPAHSNVSFSAKVDVKRRKKIMANHTATHLLHAALRNVLGNHVEQRGSLVNEHVLRFDFSHFQKMTEKEILQVERQVNEHIRMNISLKEERAIPIAEAKARGAMALFGEKYGDEVRVITFDPDYSVELCGGTHVNSTGNIGFFKILHESSISSGVRRIEAITGEKAEKFIEDKLVLIKNSEDMLNNPQDLAEALGQLIKQKNELIKEVEKFHDKQVSGLKNELIQQIRKEGDLNILITKVTLPSADALKKISFEIKNQINSLIMVLAADIEGKPQISIVISESIVKSRDLNAGLMVKDLAKNIKGGGGGQAFFATAGGKDLSGLDNVVLQAKEMLKELV